MNPRHGSFSALFGVIIITLALSVIFSACGTSVMTQIENYGLLKEFKLTSLKIENKTAELKWLYLKDTVTTKLDAVLLIGDINKVKAAPQTVRFEFRKEMVDKSRSYLQYRDLVNSMKNVIISNNLEYVQIK